MYPNGNQGMFKGRQLFTQDNVGFCCETSGGGTTLPQNIIDGLNGANAPSGANPFATIADITSLDTNIYNTNGSLTASRLVTLAGFPLRFDNSSVGSVFVIGGSPAFFPINTYPTQIQNNAVIGGTLAIGGTGGPGSPYLLVSSSAGIASIIANTTNELVLRSGTGQPLRLQSNASTTTRLIVLSSGLVGINMVLPTAALHVTGTGATSGTRNFETQNSTGTAFLRIADDGMIFSQTVGGVHQFDDTSGPIQIRVNGVGGSFISWQVTGVTLSSYITTGGASRFAQAAAQRWEIHDSTGTPQFVFDETLRQFAIGTAGVNQSKLSVTAQAADIYGFRVTGGTSTIATNIARFEDSVGNAAYQITGNRNHTWTGSPATGSFIMQSTSSVSQLQLESTAFSLVTLTVSGTAAVELVTAGVNSSFIRARNEFGIRDMATNGQCARWTLSTDPKLVLAYDAGGTTVGEERLDVIGNLKMRRLGEPVGVNVAFDSGKFILETGQRDGVGTLFYNQFKAFHKTTGFNAADTHLSIEFGLTEVAKIRQNGDVETLLNTAGHVVLDRNNGNRYRIYTDGGVVNTELA